MTTRQTLALFLIATLAVSALAFVVTGNVFAQDGDEEELDCRRGAFRLELNLRDQLDMEPAEIRDFIMEGGTIEELLEANGIDVEAIREEALQHAQACIEQAVEAGQITQERADAMLEAFESREFMPMLGLQNRIGQRFGRGMGFGRGNFGPGSFFNDGLFGPRGRMGQRNFGPGGQFFGPRGSQRGVGPF